MMFELSSHVLVGSRTTTHYWKAGPADGPLMIFLHGWPEIGLVWRAQMKAFATEGWRCIAPDLRGYGNSVAPEAASACAIEQIVLDTIELLARLGGQAAVWIGHDWGSPIVASIAAHYPSLTRGVVLLSVPYLPEGWALPNLIPFVDRSLYPSDEYPDGQWDYWRFYLTHFDQTVSDMNADIRATLASLFRKASPSSIGTVSPSAKVTINGGRYGSHRRAPAMEPDQTMWPKEDFETLVTNFQKTGFRPANSYYLNDDANIAYAKKAMNGGELNMPVLFVNDEYEPFSNINSSRIGDPMRSACANLQIVNQPAGHWLPLERKTELTQILRSWIEKNSLR